jgi:hypothetical protein
MTTTSVDTVQAALDKANPNDLADCLQKVKLGTMLTPLKRVFTGVSSSATQDLTALDADGETTGASNPNRLPALLVNTLLVTTGAAASGGRAVTSAGATAATSTFAKISDDGTTLTFDNTVTGFTIEYMPRAQVDMQSALEF